MTNPLKGEVAFTSASGAFTLVFDINALCALEEQTGRSALELMAELSEGMRVTTLRLLLWAGLQRHHAPLTLDQAGAAVTGANLQEVAAKVTEAMLLAFPPAEEVAKSDADPRKGRARKAGTGQSSSATGSS